MVDNIKTSNVKALLGVSGSLIAIVVALFAVDSRYAHAEDVAKENAQLKIVIEQTTQNLRKQMIEDKLFELDLKKEQSPNLRLSPPDAAVRARYQRQIEEINTKKLIN